MKKESFNVFSSKPQEYMSYEVIRMEAKNYGEAKAIAQKICEEPAGDDK